MRTGGTGPGTGGTEVCQCWDPESMSLFCICTPGWGPRAMRHRHETWTGLSGVTPCQATGRNYDHHAVTKPSLPEVCSCQLCRELTFELDFLSWWRRELGSEAHAQGLWLLSWGLGFQVPPMCSPRAERGWTCLREFPRPAGHMHLPRICFLLFVFNNFSF